LRRGHDRNSIRYWNILLNCAHWSGNINVPVDDLSRSRNCNWHLDLMVYGNADRYWVRMMHMLNDRVRNWMIVMYVPNLGCVVNFMVVMHMDITWLLSASNMEHVTNCIVNDVSALVGDLV